MKQLLLFPALLLLATCSRDQRAGERLIIDGVEVLRYGEQDSVPENPYLIEERLVFGTDQSESTYLLSGARPAALGEDGTLYVIDIRDTAIHRFNSDGTHAGRFGRQGEGPGEFLGLSKMLIDGESIYFTDYRRNMITITDLEGAYKSRIPVTSPSFFFGNTCLIGSGDGRIFLSCGIYPVYPRDDRFKIILWDRSIETETVLIDTLLAPMQLWINERNYPMFHPNTAPRFAAASDMPVAWYQGDKFRVDYFNPLDRSRWAVIIPREAISVTNEMKEQYLSSFERMGVAQEARREATFPATLPHAAYLMWDKSGRLWVSEYQDPTVQNPEYWFQVFSRDGKWLFRQELPTSRFIIPQWCILTGNGYYVRSSLDDGTPVIRYFEFVERKVDP